MVVCRGCSGVVWMVSQWNFDLGFDVGSLDGLELINRGVGVVR